MKILQHHETSRTKGHHSRALALAGFIVLPFFSSASNAQIPNVQEQLSALQASLPQLQRENDWNSINQNLESILDIVKDGEKLNATQSLEALSQSADWHLAAIDQDKDHRIANHLLDYQELQKERSKLAQSLNQTNTRAVAPYIYDEALAQVYIAIALLNTVGARDELLLRTEGISSTNTHPARITSRADFNNRYASRSNEVIDHSFRRNMRSAIITVESLYDSLLEEGDYEAAAMNRLFIGDLILVERQFTPSTLTVKRPQRGSPNIGRAMSHYEEAIGLFNQAQINSEQIAAVLSCPAIVPAAQLDLSLDSLTSKCPVVSSGGSDYMDLGSYYTLNSIVPGMNQSKLIDEDLVNAEIEFQIGINGQTSRQEILSITPDTKRNRRLIDSVINNLQYRPAIIGGELQTTSKARLSVSIPAEA